MVRSWMLSSQLGLATRRKLQLHGHWGPGPRTHSGNMVTCVLIYPVAPDSLIKVVVSVQEHMQPLPPPPLKTLITGTPGGSLTCQPHFQVRLARETTQVATCSGKR